jgi:carboxyl-terminal processing protease
MNDPLTNRRRPFPLVVVVLAAFLLGVLAERSGWLPGAYHQPPGLGRTFEPFWEAWRLVEQHYVDRASVQPKRMTEGAIAGMLDSLGDTGHTTYLTAEELQRLEQSLKGQMEGIGARMTMRKRRPTIVQTMPDSPARAAGLRPGDVLLEVEGKPVDRLPLELIVQQVRGPAGSVVHLRVLREGQARPLDFTIERAKVKVPEVAWQRLPGVPIAHVSILEFGAAADARLKEVLRQVRQEGLKGVLLDLRGNPGGLKEQAVAVTSEFLKDGNVFLEQDAEGRRTPVPVKPGGVAVDLPLCVLIDEGTASSAEILAGALQDHGRAKLVGTRTFGTGTVLQPFDLRDGSAVLLAVAQWLTPKGRQIWHHGIAPDVEVALPEGATILLPESGAELDEAALRRSEDKQLLKALEVLMGQIR